MADPRYLINGQDLYALGYVSQLLNVGEKKTFRRDKLISNSYNFTVENYDNFFTPNNASSMFSGGSWMYSELQVYNRDNELIWDGILTGIDRNHNTKTAILKTKNKLFQYRNAKVSYTSTDWETPADAVKNIMDSLSFTGYNEASINTSSAQYVSAGCYIKCDINYEDDLTLQACIEKLADYGNADAYNHLGNLYFVHWQEFTGGVSVSLDAGERDKFKSLPIVTEVEADIINDYSIGYYGDLGVAAIDSANGDIGSVSRSKYGIHSLLEMSSSNEAQIVFKDLTSAVYIGEGYIKRTQKNLSTDPEPLSKYKFNLFADNKEWISLQSYFKLTLSDEDWTNKISEVFEFTISEDSDDIAVTAYEVIE